MALKTGEKGWVVTVQRITRNVREINIPRAWVVS
jgi:hypothetical protein